MKEGEIELPWAVRIEEETVSDDGGAQSDARTPRQAKLVSIESWTWADVLSELVKPLGGEEKVSETESEGEIGSPSRLLRSPGARERWAWQRERESATLTSIDVGPSAPLFEIPLRQLFPPSRLLDECVRPGDEEVNAWATASAVEAQEERTNEWERCADCEKRGDGV